MEDIVKDFINFKEKLNNYFNCDSDYFFKIIVDFEWEIKSNENIHILKYWKKDEKINECVIVKKDGNPLIYKGKDYSMIIVIECIKIGLIVKNKN